MAALRMSDRISSEDRRLPFAVCRLVAREAFFFDMEELDFIANDRSYTDVVLYHCSGIIEQANTADG